MLQQKDWNDKSVVCITIKNIGTYGIFRQSLNGTGNGNLINTNGFLDIMLSFHTAMGIGLET